MLYSLLSTSIKFIKIKQTTYFFGSSIQRTCEERNQNIKKCWRTNITTLNFWLEAIKSYKQSITPNLEYYLVAGLPLKLALCSVGPQAHNLLSLLLNRGSHGSHLASCFAQASSKIEFCVLSFSILMGL